MRERLTWRQRLQRLAWWAGRWLTWKGWKWRIASWYSDRHPEICWVKLANWPLGYSTWRDALEYVWHQPCHVDPWYRAVPPHVGWCGKCKLTPLDRADLEKSLKQVEEAQTALAARRRARTKKAN